MGLVKRQRLRRLSFHNHKIKNRECQMSSRILSGAVLAGFLLAVAAPFTAYAADPPKTKEECEKTKDMKWDEATKTCVPK
jgi:hypothetical protein